MFRMGMGDNQDSLQRWDDLRIFLAVSVEGSFSKASKRLSVEQSTVSRRIAALEDSLGFPLFDRQKSGVVLTEEGVMLKKKTGLAAQQFGEFQSWLESRNDEVEGLVKLALTESTAVLGLVPLVLPQLQKQFPKLRFRLNCSYEAESLGIGEAEIAIRFFRPKSGDYVSQRIGTIETTVIGHPRFLEIEEKPWITVQFDDFEVSENGWLKQQYQGDVFISTNSYLAQIEAVRQGLGVALVAKSILKFATELVEIPGNYPEFPRLEVWLVCPSALRQTAKISAVWDAITEHFGIWLDS